MTQQFVKIKETEKCWVVLNPSNTAESTTLAKSLSKEVNANTVELLPGKEWWLKKAEWKVYEKKQEEGIIPNKTDVPIVSSTTDAAIVKPNWDAINAQKKADIEKNIAERKAEHDQYMKVTEQVVVKLDALVQTMTNMMQIMNALVNALEAAKKQ